MNFLLADSRSLPVRYRRGLAEAGLTPENFQAFYDKDLGEWVVNPRNIKTLGQLNDAIIRNFIPNTFAGQIRIHPVDSFTQASGNPAVARQLGRDPRANQNINAIYDPQSGTAFLNVQKHLNAPEPVADALRTAVHETSVHHGLRQQFGSNFADYDAFLDRVYNGMRNGRGDQIAAQFGTDMDGLARKYGLGTEQPDGTLALKPAEQRRLAEELLARYAERFSPRQLDRAPGILKKAINLVKDGFSRFQGIHLSDHDAFRVIQDAWRGAEPPRDPEAANSLIAKRIANNYRPH
jgi:uncharacterized protein with von Willebrand factor type A (vWA) domain